MANSSPPTTTQPNTEKDMSERITFTATTRAWMSGTDSYTVRRMTDAIEGGDSQEVIDTLGFSNASMDAGSHPWVAVGTAEITVTIESTDALVSGAVKALQRELAAERAESMKRQNAILDRISKLQALEYVEAA